MRIPQAYLRPPFEPSDFLGVLAGWDYEPLEIEQHGIDFHGAIDFSLLYGSPVKAAANGYALATWDEYFLKSEAGALLLTGGTTHTFGQGLMVQVWHGNGRYTQYAHLSRIAEGVPFHQPTEKEGDLLPTTILRAPVLEYRQPTIALKVRAGDVIGWTGLSGCAIGARTYDIWKDNNFSFDQLVMMAFRPQYMLDHLHFVEFSREQTEARTAVRRDPFGLYATAPAYSSTIADWHRSDLQNQQHHSLWLPNK